jgi:sigma-B regulation protein RsbU (phosphoserine phosphatase)
VTRPLHALVGASLRLAEGDFDTRVDIRSTDEFGDMGRVFNQVVPRMEAYTRMRRSMGLAREVQQSLLPETAPAIAGLDIAGTTISCEETGGDYFDYVERCDPDGCVWAVAVGDVSDHGLPSALLMASARAYLRQRAAMPGGIDAVVTDVNRQLTRDVEASGRFMTLFCCELDTRLRRMTWVRAGHDPGITYDPAADRFEALDGQGPALGIAEDAAYLSRSAPLTPGRVIVIGTDGIWETHAPDGSMFGKQRLHNLVRRNAHRPAAELVAVVISAVADFRRTSPQEDDITLVVVKDTRGG